MSVNEILRTAAGQGHRIDMEKGTISGLISGIAFLAEPRACTLDMAVSIPDDRLPKLQDQLREMGSAFALLTVERHTTGIRIVCPGVDSLHGEAYGRFLETCAAKAAGLVGAVYDDRFEKDREPVSAYFRGIAGALLGAVAGVLPWFLGSLLLHFQFGWLAFLVSTGSFFGYRWLRGAHNTSFATALIVISSLVAVFLSNLVENSLQLMQSGEMTFLRAVAYLLQGEGLQSLFSGMLFGLLFVLLGLAAIRGRVLTYTHESWYLRRPRRRK